MSLRRFPSSFYSIQYTVLEEMSFEEFQDGPHGGHPGISEQNNFSNSESLYHSDPIKFLLNPTYGLGHLGYRNGTILAILNLYNAPKLHIKFRLNLTWFGRRCRKKIFKMAHIAAILDIGTILTILNLCITMTLPFKFWLNPNYSLGGDVV